MKIQKAKDFGSGRLKAVIYGDAGVGKTRLAKTMPPKTLVVSVESGLLTISDSKLDVIDCTTDDSGAVIPRENRIARLAEVYKYLLTKEAQEAYENVFIDGISEISDNLYEKYRKKYPEKKDGLNMWEEIKSDIRALVRSFRDLPNYNVIFTALETKNQDDQARQYVGPFAQPKSFAEELPKFLDFVWRLELHETDKGIVRKLRTQPTDRVRAKTRQTDLVQLTELEDANLSAIFDKMKGKTNVVS